MSIKKMLLACAAFAFTVAAQAAVNINTADKATLAMLDGVGEVLAERIIQERASGGPFKDGQDLTERTKGLGEAFLRDNADQLRFEPTP